MMTRNLSIVTLVLLVSLSAAGADVDKNGPGFRPAPGPDSELPHLLLIGDSICSGYSDDVVQLLKGKANVDVWISEASLANPSVRSRSRSILNHGPYDVIHFNLGPHGLGDWGSDQQYASSLYESMRVFFNYSTESRLIWASTTPVRIPGTTRLDNRPHRNPLIVERNAEAAQLMSRNGIQVDDLYSLTVKQLDLGCDDGEHWSPEGYRLMARQIAETIQGRLGPPIRFVLPTYKDVPYGPHARNTLNFWQAESERPAPVVMLIHGGGWSGGGKAGSIPYRNYLAKGISVVSINYRLIRTDILPAPVYDAARALQFVRSKAREWHINKERIAVTGGSAGGATSLWLAYHDDLANPESDDPVSRESTKPYCEAVESAQTCLDPFLAREWIGDLIVRNSMLWRAVGAESPQDLLQHYDKYRQLSHDFSAYFHVDRDDPPTFLINHHPMTVPAANAGNAIHHPAFLIKIKERADQAGAECQLILRDPRQQNYFATRDFIISKLLADTFF